VLLFAPSLRAQPPGVTATAEPDKTTVALSGAVRATLTLDGPAPLRVELPKQLLTADADAAWRVRPEGPAAVTPVGPGRERWRQVYRLDPFADASPLVVSFNPVTVNGQSVTWPPFAVNVEKKVTLQTAILPVTPPEDVPIPPPPHDGPSPLPWIAAAVGVVVLVVLAAARRRARRAAPVPPGEWALARLAKLDAPGATGAAAVERVADVLRTFVERRFAIPATKLTTGELLAAARAQGWPVEQADALRVILDECDRAKFAGDVPDHDGCRRLVRLAVDWLNDLGRAVGPG
jgi:hypothetical protein